MSVENVLKSNDNSIGVEDDQKNDITNKANQFEEGFPNDVIGEDENTRRTLVNRLHLASQLEHCLLNAYIYTACSIKSIPEEFDELIDGHRNRRMSIQFERAREWKQSVLMVAHEEMIHLHYVQCMLRALGERPYFQLPQKNEKHHWWIPNWKPKIGEILVNDGKGTIVPIESCTLESIKHFVLYESSDPLQVMDPFGQEATKLFERLFNFEIRLRIESMLADIDDTMRNDLAEKLFKIYTELPPLVETVQKIQAVSYAAELQIDKDEFHFQSIGDFYNNGIEPLYDIAFEKKWVKYNNIDLLGEQLNPNIGAEGFLPVGPIYRSKNFEKEVHSPNSKDPYDNRKNISRIIKEIVEEGEGFNEFKQKAEYMLDIVEKPDGARNYLLALSADINKKSTETSEFLPTCQNVRQSHLYRFAMIMTAFKQEKKLANQVNTTFEVHRQPIDVNENIELKHICEQLPLYFNACYLVMIMWLSRMYEVKGWQFDKSRRQAIEMIATWPIMSIGVRPFLELASFFPIDKIKLFSICLDDLPSLPDNARQLFKIYSESERSEEINEKLDEFALNTLKDIAKWAEEKHKIIENLAITGHEKKMILARLTGLTVLKEFEPQFTFREHGGYSNKPPDLSYQWQHTDSSKYEENPARTDENDDPIKVFENILLLRLRFSGWGHAQLATDPDPPNDESGCTGTHMIHAADGERVLNRALVWQKHLNDPTEFAREPTNNLPKIGVNCVNISLMASGEHTKVGYIPLSVMQSTGAVQTSGTQMELSIQGLNEVLRYTPNDIIEQPETQIRIDLLDKDGKKPFLLGENHLIWKDGEPIDPFILSISSVPNETSSQDMKLEFQREIFNENKSMTNMMPLERLLTARGPVGFDNVSNIPAWAKLHFFNDETKMLTQNEYPKNYLQKRAHHLFKVMHEKLDTHIEQLTAEQVTDIISFAERMKLVSFPRNTTVGWLSALLHYGHTISGKLDNGQNSRILKTICDKTGLSCSIFDDENRNATNSRWLIKYTLGMMDTDALSSFVFGELYVPLNIAKPNKQIKFSKEWLYNIDLYQAIASFGCSFTKPFWRSDYIIQDKQTRTLAIKINKKDEIILIERCVQDFGTSGYEYTQEGFKGIKNCHQYIKLEHDIHNKTKFTWMIIFEAENAESVVYMTNFFGEQSAMVNEALQNNFTPDILDS
ncbi:hypothetical protein I4U23_005769 [Adineta vaga]|nr:hypothetical protein I4U23_005769 [Adineta vaga]